MKKKTNSIPYKWLIVFVIYWMFLFTLPAYAGDDIFLFDPVISNTGGYVGNEQTTMGIFLGLPVGHPHLTSDDPNRNTTPGSGFVHWEHMRRTISGKVVNNTAEPVANTTIKLLNAYSTENRQIIYAQTLTDHEGNYTLYRVPARNDFTLLAIPDNAESYLSQYYDEKNAWQTATAVSTLPGNLEQINFTLQKPPDNGITGQVFNPTQEGLENVPVTLYSESIGISKTTRTAANGVYAFRGIEQAADYVIYAWSDTYQTKVYYQSETSSVSFFDQASHITVENTLISNIHMIIDPQSIVYLIVATAKENGRITPAGQVPVNCQADQSFAIIPDEGFYIDQLLIDNILITPQENYTFLNVQSSHTIDVDFSALSRHTIHVIQSDGGTITPEGTFYLLAGEKRMIVFTPDENYSVSDVLIDGQSMGSINQYLLSVSGNDTLTHTVSAVFEPTALQSVSGHILFDQNPVPQANVYLSFSENQYTTVSDSDGYYQFSHIPALDQGLLWVDASHLYTKGYYPSRISTQDGDLTDMDIYVERIYNGIIKGCIRFDGLDNQNPDVSVLAFSESDRQYFNTTTDKNGNYTLTSMPPGEYMVMVRDSDFSTDYYYCATKTATSVINADIIPLTPDALIESIDLTITSGGRISGTVYQITTEDAQVLPHIVVNARSFTGTETHIAITDDNGDYTITNLSDTPSDAYIIEILPASYQYQAFPGKSNPDEASRVYSGAEQIDFYLVNHAEIEGTVYGPPEAKLELVAHSLSTSHYAQEQVVLSSEGMATYRLTQLLIADDYELTAYPNNYPTTIYPELLNVTFGSLSHIDLTITSGTTLSGWVQKGESDRLANVSVHIDSDNSFESETLTNEQGIYTFSGMIPGKTYTIRVNHHECMPFHEEITIAETDVQVFNIVLETGHRLTGEVTYNDNPVPGVVIVGVSDTLYRNTTVIGYNYTLTGLLPGDYTITASGVTYEPLSAQIHMTDSDQVLDFHLNKSYRSISGTIVNMNPDETARIRAWSPNGSDKTLNVTATQANAPVDFKIEGLLASDDYILEVNASQHPVHYYSDKFGFRKADELNLSRNNADHLLFSLVEPYMITGSVNIPAFPMGIADTSVLIHAVSKQTGCEGHTVLNFSTPGIKSYTIINLKDSDDYLVSVQSENFVNHFFDNAQEMDATEIDTASPVPAHFTMTGGVSISGTVVDTENIPQSNLLVLAWSQNTGSRGLIHTDSNGFFEIMGLVQADDFIVQVWNDNNVTFFYHPTQIVRRQDHAYKCDTMRSDVSDIKLIIRQVEYISGIVTDRTNKPIENVLVTAVSEITLCDGSTFTDSSGHYEIKSLLSGNDYVVNVVHDEWEPEIFSDIATKTELDFVLDHKPVYRISGRVVDPQNNGVAKATIEIWSESKGDYLNNSTLTDSEGTYQMTINAPGNYTITASPNSDTNLAFNYIPVLIERTTAVTDIVLSDAFIMSGQVTYTDNRPVVNATVILQSSQRQYVKKVKTNDQGNFAFANIPDANDYQLSVFPLQGAGKKKQNLSPAQDVDFKLFRNSTIDGYISDKSSGKPIANAWVEVFSNARPFIPGFSEFSYTDDTGYYRFNNLRMNDDNDEIIKDYVVTVYADGYLSDRKTNKKGGDSVDIPISKDSGGTRQLSGQVISTNTYDFFIIKLMKDGSHFERYTQADSDGYFVFNNLNKNREYGLQIIPYLNQQPQQSYTPEQLYTTDTDVLVTYAASKRKRNAVLSITQGDITQLESLSHLINVISNASKLSFQWDYSGNLDDISGYYLLLTTEATYSFNILNVLNLSPISHQTYTSKQIETEYERYYFHIAPVYVNGEIGKTISIGPYPVDTVAPNNINIIAPATSNSLQIDIQFAVTGASEMYISSYNFAEGSFWEPWKKRDIWLLMDIPDKQYLYVQFRDRAGNIANTLAETIYKELILYTIRTEKMGGIGAIAPADPQTGDISVKEGFDQTITFEANPGYLIYTVEIDNNAVQLTDNSYTLENIRSDHDVRVMFRASTHTITISSGAGGWISPCMLAGQCDGNQSFGGQIVVDTFDTKSFSFVPKFGYEIDTVFIDGQPVSTAQHTFMNISDDHILSVAFKKISTPPEISFIADRVIDENSASHPFQFTVTDKETPVSQLSISFISDNEAIIPVNQIIFSSIEGNRYVYALSPLPDKIGSVNIHVMATDTDQMTDVESFTVHIKDVPYPPVLSVIEHQTIEENTSTTKIPFTLSDPDGGNITLTAQSSDNELLENAKIVFHNGANYASSPFTILLTPHVEHTLYVEATPQKDHTGNCNISIAALDPTQLSDQSIFALMVQPYQPQLKTFYGFIYNEFNMGLNDVQVIVDQPAIQDYTTVTYTQQETAPNGQAGDGFFSFILPNNTTYSFYATKSGYRATAFDSFPASLEMETATEAFFKPLYLSNCENDMLISGNMRINHQALNQSADLYLVGNQKDLLASEKNYQASQFSFCVSGDIYADYMAIASVPDYYTYLTFQRTELPLRNTMLNMEPIQKTAPVVKQNGNTTQITSSINIKTIGGQKVRLTDQNNNQAGFLEIEVLSFDCVADVVQVPYTIHKSQDFDHSALTNGSTQTLIEMGLTGNCQQFEMILTIPVEAEAKIADFETDHYTIHRLEKDSSGALINMNAPVDSSDILSLGNGSITFRSQKNAIFGIGKKEIPEDVVPCIDCDQKPDSLCFLGVVEDANPILSVVMRWLEWFESGDF